jgi:NTP pyrophosphatase (non-canonical NTP hydrolase)
MEIKLVENIKMKNSILQLRKINEEFYELSKALIESRHVKNFNLDDLKEEIFDVMQAAFTLLVNLFDEKEIIEANKKHIEKIENRFKKGELTKMGDDHILDDSSDVVFPRK